MTKTLRRRLAGVAFLLVPVLLVWLSVAVYNKRFTDAALITLRTGNVGHQMHPLADVKVRGVVVGEVRTIAADGAGARLTLAIQPEQLRRIPANVTAQMLPTTVFGARFVALIPPAAPSSRRLAAGGVIAEDRTSNAIELQVVMNNLMRLLTAVKPAKLSATLNAMAQALEGKGEQLGRTLVQLEAYLAELNPHLPELNANIKELVKFSHLYSEATPDILQALTDFTTTSKTIVDQRENLSELYATVTGSSQDVTAFLRANSGNLIRLAAHSRPTLELLARYAPQWPCTLGMLSDFVPLADKVMGKGTEQPGLHVKVLTVKSKGRYLPGVDRPVYRATGGPRCYSVPYGGRGTRPGDGGPTPSPTPTTTTSGTPTPSTSASTSASASASGSPEASASARPTGTETASADSPAESLGGALGPNSPAENRLVNELFALERGLDPQELPNWSSVLTGPLYRGVEVRIQ
ncbi:MCE family protein [Nonomuraea sp. NN258]|uniref:MCE family protein n=1 Tax=Nonomuraea antri TaxID=2730852 RepID=UPI0015684BEF|nr:MCE family protein [Nonomuraea antri]NRQ39548.1 MCE family protein [Nonomuraea antri]